MNEQLVVFDEKLLLDAYFRFNDIRSIDILFNNYRFHVLRFIKSKISSLEIAEDLTQETFIKAYIAIDSFRNREDSKFKSWLFRIANNLVVDYFRQSNKRFLLVEASDIVLNHFYYEDSQLDIDRLKAIEIVLNQLYLLTHELLPEQKEVIDMRLKQNLTFKQIALIQNSNINTVLGRYRYAITHLKNKVLNIPNFKIQEQLLFH
jgi:RNA polymerase sigma-70 factor (ECF subfamily)